MPDPQDALWLGLLDTSLDCIVVMDARGVVTEFNPAAQSTFGYTREEAVGSPLADLIIPPALRDAHTRGLQRYLATGEAVMIGKRIEVTAVRKDGSELPVELAISRIGPPERALFIGALRDITERRRLRDDLRDADRRKDEFLAMLAHELRNPLAPMMNATALLRTFETSPRAMKSIEVLERQVRHMARLVDDLLEVSRVSQGKIALQRERLDVVDLVREVCADREESARSSGLQLLTGFPDSPLWIHGDRTRLSQVFVNVIGNAIKFTESGGAVRVGVGAVDSRAVIRIADTGAGIDPATLPHVFEPFTQADRSLQRRRGGLGLGLSVSRGLVQMHAGTIAAESEGIGKGTEIRIELPLALREDATKDANRIAPSSRTPSLRILLIEDNEDSADTLAEVLESQGHRVHVEYTGVHAVDVVRSFHPDVVLCDIGLPEKDGFTVASEIHAMFGDGGPTLVALTGYGSPEDRAKARRAGFDKHLTKPIAPSELAAALAER